MIKAYLSKFVNKLNPILYLLPAIIMIIVYFGIPFIFLIATSLTNWTAGRFDNVEFIGVDNYIRIFSDKEYWQTFLNTFIWVGAAIFIHVPLCLVTAIILSQKPFFWKFFRTVYFFPNIIALFTLAWMWLFLFMPNIGLINEILRTIGLDSLSINWLGTSSTALGALIFTWMFSVGYFTIIFLSQIGTIPNELYEAATVDGANEFKKALYITIPMLRNAIIIVVLLTVTFTFRTFEVPFVMTRGGPGISSMILPLMLYNRMVGNHGAIANTIGTTMVILGIIIVFSIRKLFASKDGT